MAITTGSQPESSFSQLDAATMEVIISQPQRERPSFTKRIHSQLTRLEMEHTPHGRPCAVRFRWCLVNFVTEHRYIGGAESRTLEHIDELDRQPCTVRHRCCPAVFRTESACRGAIRRLLAEALSPIVQRYDDYDIDDTEWDQFVPAGLAERIVAGAASSGWRSFACDVWMHVDVTRVYSEAEELLRLCEAAPATAPTTDPAPPPGAIGDACPICMEELADGGVTGLPDCPHAFHRGCILEWFRKAPTCPCCRRDMSHYLSPTLQHGSVTFAAMESAAAAAISSELAAVARANSSAAAGAIRRHHQHHRVAPYGEQHATRSDINRSNRGHHLLVAVRSTRDDDSPA